MSDTVETSNEARLVESEQYQERQKRKSQAQNNVKEAWYELASGGRKVVKKTLLKNGNTFSTYVGSTKDPEVAKLVSAARKKHKG